MVGIGSGFLQGGIAGDHFAGDQIFADAEVLKRALSLRAPEFVSRNIYFAEAVCFLANFRHFVFSFVYSSAWWPSFVDSSPSYGGIDPERAGQPTSGGLLKVLKSGVRAFCLSERATASSRSMMSASACTSAARPNRSAFVAGVNSQLFNERIDLRDLCTAITTPQTLDNRPIQMQSSDQCRWR